MKQKRKINQRTKAVFPILIWSVITLWCAIFLFMVAWGLMTSFKSAAGFEENSYWLLPWQTHVQKVGIPGLPALDYWQDNWAFDNYIKVLSKDTFWVLDRYGKQVYFLEMLFNTLYYVIVYGFAAIIGPMLCSYIYAKYHQRVRWVNIAWILVLVNMYVPLSASLAASLKLAMQLRIYDNLYLFMLTFIGGFDSNFLIYYAIWKGLSWEYAEAAFMDGASHWTVLVKVMFPMTLTVFWVLFVSRIIALWADYQTAMVFLPSYPTLAYGVYSFQFNSTEADKTGTPIRLAALYAVALPMFALFMIFKEKMMGSLTMGGLKG